MSENVTKTKEQDGRKPGEAYRDADGVLVCGQDYLVASLPGGGEFVAYGY